MNANELRIGNYGNISGIDVVLTIQDIYDFYHGKIDIKPVQISKEWINGFGFEFKQDGTIKDNTFNEIECDVILKWEEVTMTYNGRESTSSGLTLHPYFDVEIDYVHQLQNIYIDLVGIELKRK